MVKKNILRVQPFKILESGLELDLVSQILPEITKQPEICKFQLAPSLQRSSRRGRTHRHCEVYSDIREQFGDLGDYNNLVDYFQAVLDRREEMEEEDRTQQSWNAAVVASNNLVTSHPRELHPIGLIQL